MTDSFEPPRRLGREAAAVFDRHAQRLYRDGLWPSANRELLAVFAETLVLYQAFWADIEEHGTLVSGRDGGLVKNPSLSGLQATRGDLIRLSRAIPLHPPARPGDATDYVDRLLSEVL
ncbi:P27 family phage terminase small subunit [Mycobacterium sp. EPa45]|uniref:P27 family phage terminase small subunit n=1 Tax=Mycobacterium sp. EPa45 TaxID=1545728 RepID=UPI000641A998|nr:P27 family phage terminase small subunit [Mycobacterium sp. EPa45]AKK28708.1 hypothetical protein AB431_20820 [Mycobacterium sp. EPa45]